MSDISEVLDKIPEENTDLGLPKDQTLIELAEMTSLGLTVRDMAQRLNKSEAWVRTHRRDPEVVALSNMLKQEAIETAKTTLISGTAIAAKTLVALASDPGSPGFVRLSAAKDLLDRVGLKTPERKQVEATVHVNDLPREERLASIKERIRRLGINLAIDEGEVVDVEPND